MSCTKSYETVGMLQRAHCTSLTRYLGSNPGMWKHVFFRTLLRFASRSCIENAALEPLSIKTARSQAASSNPKLIVATKHSQPLSTHMLTAAHLSAVKQPPLISQSRCED